MQVWKQLSNTVSVTSVTCYSRYYSWCWFTWEKHTNMEYQHRSWYSSISISANEYKNFILKGSNDQFILSSQMCIRKCNITAVIFFKGSECWGGGIMSMKFQSKQNFPTLKERLSLDKCSILNIYFFAWVLKHWRTHFEHTVNMNNVLKALSVLSFRVD